jgi:hypothetical protein
VVCARRALPQSQRGEVAGEPGRVGEEEGATGAAGACHVLRQVVEEGGLVRDPAVRSAAS